MGKVEFWGKILAKLIQLLLQLSLKLPFTSLYNYLAISYSKDLKLTA